MGYPANVLSKGSYIFRKYQNPDDVPPFRHARITLEDMEDTPGDGVSILLLSDELTPTCSGWKQQGHGLVVSVFDSEFLFGKFGYTVHPVINIADKEAFGVHFHFEDITMFVTEWIDK